MRGLGRLLFRKNSVGSDYCIDTETWDFTENILGAVVLGEFGEWRLRDGEARGLGFWV